MDRSLKIYHDSHDIFYRDPFGAVPTNHRIRLRLKIESEKFPDSVIICQWIKDKEIRSNMKLAESLNNGFIYSVDIITDQFPHIFTYYFIITSGLNVIYYGDNHDGFGGFGSVSHNPPRGYQVTVYSPKAVTPAWFKDAVMYQIYVDRFYNGNPDGRVQNPKKNSFIHACWDDTPIYIRNADGRVIRWTFFGGNLLGVIKKLSYLKELGVDVIYFNPIFESSSNHKYDTGDYTKVDPMYGDNDLFKELCSKAREMGINIILDGVFSHTGSDSIYFNKKGTYPQIGACQSKNSPYYKWFRFIRYPDKYECWWDIDDLPNVNEMDKSYLDFIIHNRDSVVNYWMGLGVKGWRLDVADELPDEFIKIFKDAIRKQDSESILIGEVWEDASNKISYGEAREYFLGEGLDSVTNYPFRNVLIDFFLNKVDAQYMNRVLMSLYENYPPHYFYSTVNLIGSHDVARIMTVLTEIPFDRAVYEGSKPKIELTPAAKEICISRLKLITLFQMTFPGVPCIYYGDETGLEGHDDPYNRSTYPWGMENQEILSWYRKIIALREKYDALRTGEWIPIYAVGDVYGYIRRIQLGTDIFGEKRQDGTFIVLFNRSLREDKKISIELEKWLKDGNMINLLDDKEIVTLKEGILSTTIKPLEGKVLFCT